MSSNSWMGVPRDALRVFILCAGSGERWLESGACSRKQLAQVGGEAILDRTLRLLGEHGVSDVHIISADEQLRRPGVALTAPARSRWTVETLLSTRVHWARWNLVLLGDVYFSESALSRLLQGSDHFQVFGRGQGSRFTASNWAEIFALRFHQRLAPAVAEALDQAVRDAEQGGRGKLWEFYKACTGQSLKSAKCKVHDGLFTDIDDITDDIDTVAEWRSLCDAVASSCAVPSL